MIEPTIEAKYFRSGFFKGHVIGARAMGRFLSGFGGRVAPPFNRFYMGGEMDVRGFDIWGISPMAYIPSSASVNVLNSDGSARLQKVITSGVESWAPVKTQIPVYQLSLAGGDTQGLTNVEYRIPLFGPVTLAAFYDMGLNRISRPGQLTLRPQHIANLNAVFPEASFDGRAKIAAGTQALRASTGVELQVMMPVVNAPFRLYWAYNPQIVQQWLIPPVVVDRSAFPNQATWQHALTQPAAFWRRG